MGGCLEGSIRKRVILSRTTLEYSCCFFAPGLNASDRRTGGKYFELKGGSLSAARRPARRNREKSVASRAKQNGSRAKRAVSSAWNSPCPSAPFRRNSPRDGQPEIIVLREYRAPPKRHAIGMHALARSIRETVSPVADTAVRGIDYDSCRRLEFRSREDHSGPLLSPISTCRSSPISRWASSARRTRNALLSLRDLSTLVSTFASFPSGKYRPHFFHREYKRISPLTQNRSF